MLASGADNIEGRQALSDLCAAYYAPVVAFLRREGRTEDESREMAHEFFARVLERNAFDKANPCRGRFRSYLLGALKHFISNQRARDLREKRGAGAEHQRLDTSLECVIPAQDEPCTEKAFDRDWAVSVLDHALTRLKEESERNGTEAEYRALKPWLTGEGEPGSQRQVAEQLGLSEGALRVAIHRLRKRFRELVKAHVGNTVDNPSEVAAEINHLIEALS